MEHKIKALAEAITSGHTKSLVRAHVKELVFNEETRHLVIYIDNAGPLHELSTEEGDHHLNSGLKVIYGDDITYELKMHGGTPNEKEKMVGHDVSYHHLKGERDKR